MQAFNNGSLVYQADRDLSVPGEYLGLMGGGFDEVRIGSYVNAATRDLHDAAQRNAIAIDNLRAGSIPAPGTLAVPAIVMLGLRPRRS